MFKKSLLLTLLWASQAFAQEPSLPELHGDGGGILESLGEASQRDPEHRIGQMDLIRVRAGEGLWSFDLALRPASKEGSSHSLRACHQFLKRVATLLPEDVAIARMALGPQGVLIEGEALSFEAINAFSNQLNQPKSGFRNVVYPGATRDSQNGWLTFSIHAIWVGRGGEDPQAGGLGSPVNFRPFQPRALKREPERIDGIEFKGCLQQGGKLFAIASDAKGNVRWLPVGYRFLDAEIVAIEKDRVILRRWTSTDSVGTTEVRSFSKPHPK